MLVQYFLSGLSLRALMANADLPFHGGCSYVATVGYFYRMSKGHLPNFKIVIDAESGVHPVIVQEPPESPLVYCRTATSLSFSDRITELETNCIDCRVSTQSISIHRVSRNDIKANRTCLVDFQSAESRNEDLVLVEREQSAEDLY